MKNKFINIYILILLYFVVFRFFISALPFSKFNNLLYFGMDLLMMSVSIGIILNSKKQTIFQKFFIGFLLISLVSYFFNIDNISATTYLNGLREPLFFISNIIVVAYIFQYKNHILFLHKFYKIIKLYLIIQVPISILQFSIYGAGDSVGGTLGLINASDGSGMTTIIIYILTFFAILHKSQVRKSTYFNIFKYSFFLIPSFINETKITFILLFLFYFYLFLDTKKLLKTISITLILILIFFTFIKVYTSTRKDPMKYFSQDAIYSYFFYGKNGNINRVGKIIELWKDTEGLTIERSLGYGYGIFKGQNLLGISKRNKLLSEKWDGSKNLIFIVLLQGGVLSLLYLFLIFYHLFKQEKYFFNKLYKKYFSILVIIFFITLVYNTAFFFRGFILFVIPIIFVASNNKLLVAKKQSNLKHSIKK